MINDLESMGARSAGDPVETKRAQKRLKVYQLHMGDERFGLLVDERNQLLAVVANRLSDKLEKVLDRVRFEGGSTQCVALQICLGAGYVMASYTAAEWLCKEGRALVNVKRHVANVLMEGVAV